MKKLLVAICLIVLSLSANSIDPKNFKKDGSPKDLVTVSTSLIIRDTVAYVKGENNLIGAIKSTCVIVYETKDPKMKRQLKKEIEREPTLMMKFRNIAYECLLVLDETV